MVSAINLGLVLLGLFHTRKDNPMKTLYLKESAARKASDSALKELSNLYDIISDDKPDYLSSELYDLDFSVESIHEPIRISSELTFRQVEDLEWFNKKVQKTNKAVVKLNNAFIELQDAVSAVTIRRYQNTATSKQIGQIWRSIKFIRVLSRRRDLYVKAVMKIADDVLQRKDKDSDIDKLKASILAVELASSSEAAIISPANGLELLEVSALATVSEDILKIFKRQLLMESLLKTELERLFFRIQRLLRINAARRRNVRDDYDE